MKFTRKEFISVNVRAYALQVTRKMISSRSM